MRPPPPLHGCKYSNSGRDIYELTLNRLYTVVESLGFSAGNGSLDFHLECIVDQKIKPGSRIRPRKFLQIILRKIVQIIGMGSHEQARALASH